MPYPSKNNNLHITYIKKFIPRHANHTPKFHSKLYKSLYVTAPFFLHVKVEKN